MAYYFAKVQPGVATKQVFDAVSAEITSSMKGICVVASGDERMGRYFSVAEDEVFKACTNSAEILQKVCDGASVGRLCVHAESWRMNLYRRYPRIVVDDATLPSRDYYFVSVTLIASDCFENKAAIEKQYANRLDPLETPSFGNRVCEIHGPTKDVVLHYRIHTSQLPNYLHQLGVGERDDVEAYGEVQELKQITSFSVDPARYDFRGLYSVYPDWSAYKVTNYANDTYARFCDLIDNDNSGLLISVGRRHCAFRCKDGSSTRTLEGNYFDISRTKVKRSLAISFDQYADEDPPVRTFSGGVRARLAELGIKI